MEEKTRPNLLIVDDDGATRRALVRALRKDFEITEAEDGLEALPMILSGSFDAVLTDLDMPGMDGVEMINTVHTADPGKTGKFVLITASPFPPSPTDLPGRIRVLRKPGDLHRIVPCLMETALS